MEEGRRETEGDKGRSEAGDHESEAGGRRGRDE